MSASLPEDLHDFDRLMLQHGYVWKRQSGSHKHYENRYNQVVSITTKGNKVAPEHVRDTLKAIRLHEQERQQTADDTERQEGEEQEVSVPEIRKRVIEAVAQKQCKRCGQFLPLTSFNKCGAMRGKTADGLFPLCKDCQRERNREARMAALTKDDATAPEQAINTDPVDVPPTLLFPDVPAPRPAHESVEEQARTVWQPGMSIPALEKAAGISRPSAQKYHAKFVAETASLAPETIVVSGVHMSLTEWLATPDCPAVFIASRFSIIAVRGEGDERAYILCTGDIGGSQEPVPVSLLTWAVRLLNPGEKPDAITGVVHQ